MELILVAIGMILASVIILPLYFDKMYALEVSKEENQLIRKDLQDLKGYYAELERHNHYRR